MDRYHEYQEWVNSANESFQELSDLSGSYDDIGKLVIATFGRKSYTITINGKELGTAGSGNSAVKIILQHFENTFRDGKQTDFAQCVKAMKVIFE